MAQAYDIEDLDHVWSGDLSVSLTGDLARVSTVERSKQHILRRLLTNPGGYLSHIDYGAGIPQRVGTVLNIPTATADIKGQMRLEESVITNPEPRVVLTELDNGVRASINYVVAPERTPAALSFNVRA